MVYTLEQIAIESRVSRSSDPSSMKIVGLDDMDSNDLDLKRWSQWNKDCTFTKEFKKGDILFGRRRAYLHKATIAPFDGICSGDITVIRPKKEIIYPGLLPHVIQSNAFFDYAVSKSAGSLSPRAKWSQLKEFQVSIPDSKDKQMHLANLLDAIQETKREYRHLISSSQEYAKSVFNELFLSDSSIKRIKLAPYIKQIRGVSYKPEDLHKKLDNTSVLLLRANNILDGRINHFEVQYVSSAKVSTEQKICSGDILVCTSSGSLNLVGKSALCSANEVGETFGAFCKLVRVKNKFNPIFLASFFKSDEYMNAILTSAQGSNINNIKNDSIDNLMIPDIPTNLQEKFCAFQERLDKSEFIAKESLRKLEEFEKSLKNKIFEQE